MIYAPENPQSTSAETESRLRAAMRADAAILRERAANHGPAAADDLPDGLTGRQREQALKRNSLDRNFNRVIPRARKAAKGTKP